jgi:hypothetical protein
MEHSKNLLRVQIAALQQSYAIRYPASRMWNCQRGAQTLVYLPDMPRVLRSVRLALRPLATVFGGSKVF